MNWWQLVDYLVICETFASILKYKTLGIDTLPHKNIDIFPESKIPNKNIALQQNLSWFLYFHNKATKFEDANYKSMSGSSRKFFDKSIFWTIKTNLLEKIYFLKLKKF